MGGFVLLRKWLLLRKYLKEPLTGLDVSSLELTYEKKKDYPTRISAVSLISTFCSASLLGLFFGGIIGTIIEFLLNPQSEITGYGGGFQGAIVGAILCAFIAPLIEYFIKSRKEKAKINEY
jgi:hypothetical protein